MSLLKDILNRRESLKDTISKLKTTKLKGTRGLRSKSFADFVNSEEKPPGDI